ncbi:beta subunit of N-acylethanolamine-hydrolyzing acid amidase-domain-containing protein [Aspergillus spectabilis]
MNSTPDGDTPPTHRINLSLPPFPRYKSLATLYRPHLQSITTLFDSLVLQLFPASYLPWIKFLARIFLRGVRDAEETAELRGIADAAGVELYLVVCLNVLLDLLMGCTSGGVISRLPPSVLDDGEEHGVGEKRMLHFRTLDWDMPALRQLLVKLEYVDGDDDDDDDDAEVLATSITYVGFVGVLTGVRKGLSVSLNFRPNHDSSSWVKQVKYYGRHLLVLLGFKRSIASVLREVIIPSKSSTPHGWRGWAWVSWLWKRKQEAAHKLSLPDTVTKILRTPSTACYLILCDGLRTYVLEKDYKTTTVESSASFIVATNSDREMDIPQSNEPSVRQAHTGALLTVGENASLSDLIKDSIARRACMQSHWDMKVARDRQAARRASQDGNVTLQARRDPLRRTRSSRRVKTAVSSSTAVAPPATPIFDNEVTATLDEVVTWTTRFPTTNEMTHFAAVLDSARGTVAWIRRYPEPLECDWEVTDFD